MPLLEFKRQLAERVANALNHPDYPASKVLSEFSQPPDASVGHVALPCFRIAKSLAKQTPAVANDIASQIDGPEIKAKVAGPYVNFTWNAQKLCHTTLSRIHVEGRRYGRDASGAGRKVLVEYCSPNIAKKLAFHHIRSTLIGNALANIYSFFEFQTERINFVGDWGSQFARLLVAVRKWGDMSRLRIDDLDGSMTHLTEIYVRFHKEEEAQPELTAEVSKALSQLESGDAQTQALWKLIRDISLAAMNRTLQRLGVKFDHIEGESTYVPHTDKVLSEIKQKAQARLSEGAWIVEVEGIPTPALVQKKDGTTLYLTRDIAAAIDRHRRFEFEKMFWVVSEQQKLHFNQLRGVLKKMGLSWSDRCEHLSFGTVLFGSEKMSTREGRVILLDDFLNEARKRALEECTEKNPGLADKEVVAEMVGIGAVVFGDLAAHRQRDIEFDWKRTLSLEGETGPYLQYTRVRCRSLLEKASQKAEWPAPLDSTLPPVSPEEEIVCLHLAGFRSALYDVLRDNEPYQLCSYLIDLAKAFNRFYYRLPVLQANDPAQKRFRLAIVSATATVLENGLQLLGIPCPEEM